MPIGKCPDTTGDDAIVLCHQFCRIIAAIMAVIILYLTCVLWCYPAEIFDVIHFVPHWDVPLSGKIVFVLFIA